MKSVFFFSIVLLFGLSAHQGVVPATTPADGTLMTTKFKVYGNCGMCEKRIEKAAKKVKGVQTADWDQDTKILTISFDEKLVKPSKVHQAVAAVGHDTDLMKADDKVYAKLHECCQYDRPVR